MDNQVLDEGTCPALCDSDNVLSLIDSEKTKVCGKFVIISKAWPPLFKSSNVPAALCVSDIEQVVDRCRVVGCKRPHTIAGRPIWLGERLS